MRHKHYDLIMAWANKDIISNFENTYNNCHDKDLVNCFYYSYAATFAGAYSAYYDIHANKDNQYKDSDSATFASIITANTDHVSDYAKAYSDANKSHDAAYVAIHYLTFKSSYAKAYTRINGINKKLLDENMLIIYKKISDLMELKVEKI